MMRVAEMLEMRHAGGGSAVAPYLAGVLLSETEAWRGVRHTGGIQYTAGCAAASCKGGQLECAVRDVYKERGSWRKEPQPQPAEQGRRWDEGFCLFLK